MTDEQIVKALRLCAIDVDVCTEACPYYEDREYFDGDCIKQRTIDAIDLINRQKAEIEKLKEAYAVYEETTGLKQVREDAIRKFADWLKLYLFMERGGVATVSGKDIDNLVKEMTEGQL
jgi:hypothetical protein